MNTVRLYRLAVSVLLAALILTALAYRKAGTARRESEQRAMLRQADDGRRIEYLRRVKLELEDENERLRQRSNTLPVSEE